MLKFTTTGVMCRDCHAVERTEGAAVAGAARGSVELDQAYKDGWEASDQAYPRESNPYHKGSALREWWDAGWSRSLDELCGT